MKRNNKYLGPANNSFIESGPLLIRDEDLAIPFEKISFSKGEILYHKGFGKVICNQNFIQDKPGDYFIEVLWEKNEYGLVRKYPLSLHVLRLSKKPFPNN
jgi:hypothetical protein